jgi:hypothetical protein
MIGKEYAVLLDWTPTFFTGTRVLNCQTKKSLFLQILEIKTIFSRKLGCIHFFSSTCGQNMSLYGKILLPKQ